MSNKQMSNTTPTKSQQGSKEISLANKAQELDAVAEQYSSALSTEASPFTSALILSEGIAALRDLLDDGIMQAIMRLADTPLGFITDRANKGGYAPKEIKDAIIEASLRGFRVAGNEFNIISGRFYGAKNGLHRKIITFPGLTDFTETFSVPRFTQNGGGAVLTAKATWYLQLSDEQDPIKMELQRELAIRVNTGMGVDAVIGKAQRKLYAAVLNRLTGTITPEGEIDDSIPVNATVTTEPAEQKPREPEATPGIWEGNLKSVETKPYKNDKNEEKFYFVLTIDNGWHASTFSESIREQAEVAIGLPVKIEVKAGRSRGNFSIVSFEVLKPEPQQPATEQDDLPIE